MSECAKKPLRIAMFGGTFDPIHIGHLMIAQTFLRRLAPDKLLLIPTRTPPHKKDAKTSGEHRLKMCALAAKELGENCEASDIELAREGKSYSVDTAEELLRIFPNSELFMIVGADMFMSLESWHEAEKLFKLATFCTVARDNVDLEQLTAYGKKLEKLGAKYIIEPVEPLDMSSTQIRLAAKMGDIPENSVSEAVKNYIQANKLYK